MRATKAYIASLGTTGLLLAFSASLLVLVGTLFAFDAWPGGEIRDAVDSVLVDDDEDAVQLAGPEQVALDAAPAAAVVAGGGSAAPGTPGGGSGGVGGFDGDGTAPGTPGGGGFDGGGGDTGGGTLPGGGVPVGGDQDLDSGRGTNQLADNTEQLTNSLGNTVGQVSPELGDTVSETGQALSDIVRDLPDVKVGKGGIEIGGGG